VPGDQPVTARDVLDLLRRHYLPEGRQPAGIFAPEIQAPASPRRADLIWQGVSIAAHGKLIGHEIKVTRSDLLAELADATKPDAWLRYCDEWWLVVSDPALIEGLEIPELWGIMAPPSGRRTRSMTVLRKAPRLKPVDKGPAYETIARWLHWRLYRQGVDHRAMQDTYQRQQQELAELRLRTPRESPARERLYEVVERIVIGLGGPQSLEAERIGRWEHEVEVADVIAALRDLGSVYRRAELVASRARHSAQDVERLLRKLDQRDLADLKAAVEKLREREPAEAVAGA
jgi:hypothetical protein